MSLNWLANGCSFGQQGMATPSYVTVGRFASLVVDYGFDVLGLERIDLNVFADNYRGIASYQKVGFVESHRTVGVIDRDGEPVDGRAHDCDACATKVTSSR